jgi:hypothetical protein
MHNNRHLRLTMHKPSPFELLKRLAESAILKQRRTSSTHGPRHNPFLPIHQSRIKIAFVNLDP